MRIELVSYILIASGTAIILSLLYLRHMVKRRMEAMLEFLELNENLGYDLHAFLKEVQPLTKNMGISRMFYRISYMGIELGGGNPPGNEKGWLTKSVKKKEYTLEMGILPRVSRGEFRYVNILLLEVLFLAVKIDIEIKIRTTNEAFINLGRIRTFIKHDIKNIAQFVESLFFNIESANSEEDRKKLLSYLKESIPHLSSRIKRLLGDLEGRESQDTHEKVDLKDTIKKLSNLFGLKISVRGNATCANSWKLQSAIENILKNIYEKSLREDGLECFAVIDENEHSITLNIEDTGSHVENTERMFEPFYTTKKGGLGIGLYQAKSLIESMGGTLSAENTEKGVRFTIKLPKPL